MRGRGGSPKRLAEALNATINAALSLNRIWPQRGLIRVTSDLLGRILIAGTISITIHTFIYVLWMGIFVDCSGLGLIPKNHGESDGDAGGKGCQAYMFKHLSYMGRRKKTSAV